MVGKASRIQTSLDRLRKQQTQIRNLQATNRNRNTPRPVATTAFAGVSAAGSTGGTGNFLRVRGDTMIGPFALAPPVDFRVDIDGSNTIDIGESSSNSQFSSNIQLDDTTTSDILDIINGAAFDGQLLVIRTFAPTNLTKTIRQATLANGGNIQTLDENDIDLGDLQVLELIFDASLIIFANTGGTWRVKTAISGGGGNGGLSEPIELGFNEVVTQTPPTKTIVAGDQFNPSHIVLDQDIEIQLDISATTNKYKSIFVIFDTTGGGFTVTWPASVVNPPIIDDSVAQRISVILYTIDNGVLFTHATSVGSSSSGSAEFFGPWTANHDAGGFDLVGLNAVDFFQAGQSITNKADPDGGILYDVADLQSHIFRANLDEIARFEESAGGVFRLDMLDHSIVNAQDVRLDDSSGAIIFPSTSPAIGFDSTTSRFILNMPTGANLFVTNNNVIGSTQINNNSLTSNIINASDVLQLGVDVTVPTVEGEFRNDGSDTFVFSGGAVRNFSDIGAGSPLTTKGDIFGFSTVGARIPVGTNGQRLTANSAVALGVEWQDVAVVIPNSISQGDSDVTVTDVGSGLVQTTIDAVLQTQIQAGRQDYFGVDIFGLEKLTFDSTVGASTITPSLDGIIWNFPDNSDDFEIQFNSIPGFNINLLRTQLLSNTPNTLSAGLSLFRDDPSPLADNALGNINFDGRNSAAEFTTYGQWIGAIENFTNGAEIGRMTLRLLDDGLDTIALQMSQGALKVNKFSSLAGEAAVLKLVKEDATPDALDVIGRVEFIVDDVSEIIYANISSQIRNATDAGILDFAVRVDNAFLESAMRITGDDNNTLTFLEISARLVSDLRFGVETGSTDLKIFPQVNQLGIAVQDNVAFTVGTAGTLAVPSVSSLIGTAAAADGIGGTHLGSMIMFDDGITNMALFIRQFNGNWGSVVFSRDVLT